MLALSEQRGRGFRGGGIEMGFLVCLGISVK